MFIFNMDYEQKIAEFWKTHQIPAKVYNVHKNDEKFYFMDGPPFVSSDSLHMGHILVGDAKSTILLYKSMNEFNTQYRLGFDCHGLPSEMAVNKRLNLSSNQDIEKFGIDKYNAECKKMINEYSTAWKPVYDSIGRWADFDTAYKTMDTPFMESVWHVFKQLWEKNLVYRGYRIMPYSTACSTPLSNFEAGQCYADKKDKAIYVKFPIINKENTSFIAWTTTPWTLPAHLMLCVHPQGKYIELIDKLGNKYIIVEGSEIKLFKEGEYKIINTYMGLELKDTEYTQPFSYYENYRKRGCFRVICDTFVDISGSVGTGIVHIAPGFGEDDFQVCVKNNIIDSVKVGEVCPVDDQGKYTDIIKDYSGIYVFDANLDIIKYLKTNKLIIKTEEFTHSYPFCWRSDTPLIYKAVSSFFVAVTKIKDQLIANNNKINWVPETVGKNRFGEWLNNIRDWGVSRSRYFGTPIPVWASDDGEELICVGSLQELSELTGIEKFDDIHREFVDNLTIPSQMGKGVLHRVSDVFDCWFESGAVPMGQNHYPFENTHIFDNREYLYDFICEGLDQTRGWFYTLLVLSTALFNKPAFKTVLCTGLILDKDGKKMSKRYGNFVNPIEVINKYSADAVRLYLLSSPAVKAEPLMFNEDDIKKISRSYIQCINCYKFVVEHVHMYTNYQYEFPKDLSNIMDIWIMNQTGQLIKNINGLMNEYQLSKVLYLLLDYIENLTNWYIKFNRERFKNKFGIKSQKNALDTACTVLNAFTKIIAPFAPFLSEELYCKLVPYIPDETKESVHLCVYPKPEQFGENTNILTKMHRLQSISKIVRRLRSKRSAGSNKIPICRVIISTSDVKYLEDLTEVKQYIYDELNCLNIEFRNNYNYKFVLDSQSQLKKKAGKYYEKVKSKLAEFNSDILRKYYIGKIQKLGIVVNNTEIIFERNELNVYPILSDCTDIQSTYEDGVLVIVDNDITIEVKEIHLERLFNRAIQDLRKRSGLKVWQKINVYYQSDSEYMMDIIKKHLNRLEDATNNKFYNTTNYSGWIIASENITVDKYTITITLTE